MLLIADLLPAFHYSFYLQICIKGNNEQGMKNFEVTFRSSF